MNNLSGYHQYLLMGKITQTLSPEEEREFEALMASDVNMQDAYASALSKFPGDWLEENFQHIKEPGYWKDLKSEISQQRTIRLSTPAWISIAATVAGLIFVAWIFFTKTPAPGKLLTAKSTKSIELKLADGKIINLNQQKGNIQTKTGKFINNDSSLSYQASEASATDINSIYVPASLDYQIVLSDGSKIFLNSMTRIDFPTNFSGTTREITIDGEAYLEIAKNPAKPFIVHLPKTDVKVLGTEFNVNSYDKDITRVALIQGSVQVNAGAQSAKIVPGEELINAANRNFVRRVTDVRKVTSWRNGLYYFDPATLQELTVIIERWFAIKAVIDNAATARKIFVGVIDKNRPIETFLDDLKAMSKVESYVDGNGVLHFR